MDYILIAIITLLSPFTILIPTVIKALVSPFTLDSKMYYSVLILYFYSLIIMGPIGLGFIAVDIILFNSEGVYALVGISLFVVGVFISWSVIEGWDAYQRIKQRKNAEEWRDEVGQ